MLVFGRKGFLILCAIALVVFAELALAAPSQYQITSNVTTANASHSTGFLINISNNPSDNDNITSIIINYTMFTLSTARPTSLSCGRGFVNSSITLPGTINCTNFTGQNFLNNSQQTWINITFNISAPNAPNTTENQYGINVTSCNSTAKTYLGDNCTSVFFGIGVMDVDVPQWSSNSSAITSILQSTEGTYEKSTLSKFNITWTENNQLSTVLWESNFSGSPHNYTMFSFGSNVYSYNDTLPGGNYSWWKSYAIDASGNQNETDVFNFTIYAKSPSMTMSLLPAGCQYPSSCDYGTVLNATSNVTSGDGDTNTNLTLYRNNTIVVSVAQGSSVEKNEVIGAGIWNYTFIYPGTQNYSASYIGGVGGGFIKVAQVAPSLTVILSPNMTYGTQTTATGTVVTGDQSANTSLYRNGTIVGTNNETNTLGAGLYNYTFRYNQSQNYSTLTVKNFTLINKSSALAGYMDIAFNGTAANSTMTYGMINTTGYCSANLENITFGLYRNGMSVVNSTAASYSAAYVSQLAIGNHTYIYNTSGNANYSLANLTRLLTVQNISTGITIYFNGSTTTSFDTGSVINITAVLNVSVNKTLYLFTNLTNYTQNNNISTTNVSSFSSDGIYNVTAWFAGDENYTSSISTSTLTFTTPTTPSAPSGGGGGGGGGGGAGGTSSKSILLDKMLTTKSAYQSALSKGDTLYYAYRAENHTIKVAEVTNTTAVLTITSNPYNMTLHIGETKNIDLDRDGTDELAVTLNSISNYVATLTFAKAAPPAAKPTENKTLPTENVTGNETGQPVPPTAPFNWVPIIAGAVIVLAIAAGLFYFYKKNGKPAAKGKKQ